MIEAKQTHCGQYKPYGDFFRIWNVQTDLPQDEVVKWCFEKLYYGKVLPIHAECSMTQSLNLSLIHI